MRNESRLCPACNDPEAASHCECGKVKDKVHPVCPYCAAFWVPCPNCGERAVGDGRCSNSFPRGGIVVKPRATWPPHHVLRTLADREALRKVRPAAHLLTRERPNFEAVDRALAEIERRGIVCAGCADRAVRDAEIADDFNNMWERNAG